MKQWVVDTWVLEKCNDTDHSDCIDCIDFLTYLLRKGKLCLDSEEEIETEYSGHIKPRTFLFQWWSKIIGEAGHTSRWSNKLPSKHQNKLLNKLSFHDDDIKFVGVASRSTDKIVVTGDSDYTNTVRTYLKNELGITVTNPTSALKPSKIKNIPL